MPKQLTGIAQDAMIDAWAARARGLDERMRMNTAEAITLRTRGDLESELDKLSSEQLSVLQEDLIVKLRGACAPNDADTEEIFEIAATMLAIDEYIDNQDPHELELRKPSDG